MHSTVIPAKAGIQHFRLLSWTPAFAGVTSILDTNKTQQTERGVALLLVVLSIAAAVALATALVSLAGVKVLASRDLIDYAEAEYLADSGLAEAAYFFSYPQVIDPDEPDAVWAGVAGRQLDDSADYYDVLVTPNPADPLFFSVVCTAHTFGQTSEKLARSVRASFLVNRGFPHAFMANQDLAIPPDIIINGNVYASGNVSNEGTITGNVQAAGTITNTGSISGESTEAFPSLQMLSYSLSNPLTYTYQGTQYQATEIANSVLNNDDWSVPPAGNPMGVYIKYGDLNMQNGNNIAGTLIVTGTLHIKGLQNTITAQAGFPALIIQQKIELNDQLSSLTANGAVIVHDEIEPTTDLYDSYIVINGPLVFFEYGQFHENYFNNPGPQMGSFIINQDISRASVSGLFPPDPAEPRQVLQLSYTVSD